MVSVARPHRKRSAVANKRSLVFDPKIFLRKIRGHKTTGLYRKKQVIYAQGDAAEAMFYIHAGMVKLTIRSKRGKRAVVAILGQGDFFGEGCLAGQRLRMCRAEAMQRATIVRVDKATMVRTLHQQPRFAELFIAYLLSRNIRIEEDLIDQLFNSSEKRLARLLLMLAQYGKESTPEKVIPKISQETLAEMIGTTRSRVSFFMNRFRKLGFLEYNPDEMRVHSSLLNVVLRD